MRTISRCSDFGVAPPFVRVGMVTLVSILFVAQGAFCAESINAHPTIQFENTTFDFEEAPPSAALEHDFIFTNTGDRPLLITKVQSTCGCTAATANEDPIEPGGTGKINSKIRVSRLPGVFTKAIYVESNDPNNPKVSLKVTGKVVPIIEMKPSDRVSFGRIAADEVQVRKITMSPPDGKSVKIELESVEADDFDVHFETIEEGLKYELVVQTKPAISGGTKRGKLVFSSNSSKLPTFDVLILAFVTQRIGVTPERLMIRPRNTGLQRGYLFVRSYDQKPMEVTEVIPPWKELNVQFTPLSAKAVWRVLFSFQASDISESRNGFVIVRTSDPEFPEFKVPITIYGPPANPIQRRIPTNTRTRPPTAASRPIAIPPVSSASGPVAGSGEAKPASGGSSRTPSPQPPSRTGTLPPAPPTIP